MLCYCWKIFFTQISLISIHMYFCNIFLWGWNSKNTVIHVKATAHIRFWNFDPSGRKTLVVLVEVSSFISQPWVHSFREFFTLVPNTQVHTPARFWVQVKQTSDHCFQGQGPVPWTALGSKPVFTLYQLFQTAQCLEKMQMWKRSRLCPKLPQHYWHQCCSDILFVLITCSFMRIK